LTIWLQKRGNLDAIAPNKEAIRAALDEYVQRRKQLDVIGMFEKIDYDENYDYKLERERKPKRR